MQASASDAYLTSQVMTATPQKLQLMLIEGAIRFVSQGKGLWQSEKGEQAGAALVRSQEIIGELLASVAGAEEPTARKAASVYLYLFRTLTEAQLEHNPEKLDDVLRVLEVERDTWQMVCENLGSVRSEALGSTSDAPDAIRTGGLVAPLDFENTGPSQPGASFEA